MPINRVKKNITELQKQLVEVPEETGALEQTLAQAKENIDRYTPETLQNFAKAIQKETEDLEAEYPKVTALINRIMMSLSSIGI